MHARRAITSTSLALTVILAAGSSLWAQAASEEDAARIREKLGELQQAVDQLKENDKVNAERIADVEIYAKAADWILRHEEFYRPNFVQHTLKALETGLKRAEELAAGKPSWTNKPGTVIFGYYSNVDESVQPYALTIPAGVDPLSGERWPLHVKLHGRNARLNEVSFINTHDNKPLPEGQTWLQLDVFARTNNGYRWSGETDVFEALADVQRRFRIDHRRITLHGFSMGGAGAWHLGLHYPSLWSSVGPGAGFVDFYKYQKVNEQLPDYQHKTLRIYDAIDYALNAYNVPICTYGGELDNQLVASTSMVERAKELGVEIKLLVGPETGHKFHPDSFKEFMAFHQQHSEKGRKQYPGADSIRFITYTPKYNQCEWLTVEELHQIYEPATVEGGIDDRTGTLKLKTKNVAVLQIARDVAATVELDGSLHRLSSAADGLLPGVYYEKTGDSWRLLDYDESRRFQDNPDLHKRQNLQGPIDDAFMQPFVCVRGTGTPWSKPQHEWADWTLARFEREFDKWLRGRVPVVNDGEVDDELITNKNLILFGDPGSNAVLAKLVDQLPITWTQDALTVGGRTYDPGTHGLALIFPNPLNPRRYVVINSGHTFHERQFRASNAQLYPRLGDIAVQSFEPDGKGGYTESVVWAELFNSGWRLPAEDDKAR